MHITDDGEFFFGPYRLIPSKRLLLRDGQMVVLGSRAFALLDLLVRKNGQIVSGREILEQVWANIVVEDANLRTQMSHLRTTLGCHPMYPTYISTIRGQGYSFVAPVEFRAASQPSHSKQSRLPGREQKLAGRRRGFHALRRPRRPKRLIGIVRSIGTDPKTLDVDAFTNMLVWHQMLSALKTES
ncbi:winged helix-turn-helix domain-containing protein [Inquilinus limosus]|nr:winged helix-turn-helix domain-containing protein [Inquilinus limosus]